MSIDIGEPRQRTRQGHAPRATNPLALGLAWGFVPASLPVLPGILPQAPVLRVHDRSWED